MPRSPATAVCGGFTLVEMMVVCAVAGLLVATAWPSWRQQAMRAARADGTQALGRIEAAQARYQSQHGMYAGDLGVLIGAGPATSEQGRYTMALQTLGADGYLASAQPAGAQAADIECAPLTLEVRMGFATRGPSARCWNR